MGASKIISLLVSSDGRSQTESKMVHWCADIQCEIRGREGGNQIWNGDKNHSHVGLRLRGKGVRR